MDQIDRRRILLVDLGGFMGGVEAYLESLAAVLTPEADLYCLCAVDELKTRLTRAGVKVIKIPLFARLRVLRFLTALIVLPYVLLRYRIDVVQINGLLEAIVLLPARLLGRRAIYTRHGPFETGMYVWYKQPAKFLPRVMARYCVHFASHVVCVSETVGSLVRTIVPKERVTVIPNWVRFLPPLRTRTAQKSKLNLLYVGRLEEYKGLQLVFDALRHIPGVRLTVVGTGSYKTELESLAAGLDVDFRGFQNDTAAFYEAADVFVMPSFGPEGLPMVALEAMAHGLPCVFSDLPVHSEITENGTNALLFRVGDAADLQTRLQQLFDDESLRQRLGARAHNAIQQHYHPVIAGRAYRALFEVGA